MPDPKIHFLNVKQGDCSFLERPSGRLTVIDICCGNLPHDGVLQAKAASLRGAKPSGNYAMCANPTNPIHYLESKGLSNIWRFILTHPDMDHMDGIKQLFHSKKVEHFWDCGIRRQKPGFDEASPYMEEDWDFFFSLSFETLKLLRKSSYDRLVSDNPDKSDNELFGAHRKEMEEFSDFESSTTRVFIVLNDDEYGGYL